MKKLFACMFAPLLIACMLLVTRASAAFEANVYQDVNGETMQYWLYTPENTAENMPLIVYLHGGSGKGSDLNAMLMAENLPVFLQDGRLAPAACVLMPQLPENCRDWADKADILLKLITYIKETRSIDDNRVSLTGHSMGGTGVWQLAAEYPKTFSAIAPLSGSVRLAPAMAQKLTELPVWAVVGAKDTIVEPEATVRAVTALQKAGGSARVTVIDGADHFAVSTFYLDADADLLGWLGEQVRNEE